MGMTENQLTEADIIDIDFLKHHHVVLRSVDVCYLQQSLSELPKNIRPKYRFVGCSSLIPEHVSSDVADEVWPPVERTFVHFRHLDVSEHSVSAESAPCGNCGDAQQANPRQW